jgi:lipoyl(octanoyl) transferase
VTSHGLAFNVSTDLDHFDLIVPCGIGDRGVTSLERVVGQSIGLRDVEARLVDAFGRVFDREPSLVP